MDNSPLGKLPAELCNEIYELALIDPEKCIVLNLHDERKGSKFVKSF
jgi:hypothetical protein